MNRFVALLAALLAAAPALAQEPAGGALPPDLSFAGMVGNADWVVRAVLAGLLAASVLTWTAAAAKGIETLAARRRLARGLQMLGTARTLPELATRLNGSAGPCADLVRVAQQELAQCKGMHGQDGARERAGWRLERIVAGAGRQLSRGTWMLATIGATAPFVGLFGTVWGIMEAFINISRSQTSSLAVVAPGIAEALLTTALGLVAAIPAVVVYNLLARGVAAHRGRLADAAADIMTLLSRELDQVRAEPDPARARLQAVVH